MNHSNVILVVLAALFTKHFIFDFVYQNGFMLMGKGKPGFAFILPLAAHAGEHGLATALIFAVSQPKLFWLGFVDMALHMMIDRVKATTKINGGLPWKPEDKIKHLNSFYFALGADQLAHGLTYIALVAMAFN